MLTKAMWERFKGVEIGKYDPIDCKEIEPSDKAIYLMMFVPATPLCMFIDLVFSPFEIIYCLLVRYYTKKNK